LLAVAAVATASLSARVIAEGYKAGAPGVDVVLAIPKGVDTAARNGNANWRIRVVVSYTSNDQTFETLDSGPVAVATTTQGASIDNNTDAITFQIPLGTSPPPGGSPGYSATAQLIGPGS
jgi:hypothetical protein